MAKAVKYFICVSHTIAIPFSHIYIINSTFPNHNLIPIWKKARVECMNTKINMCVRGRYLANRTEPQRQRSVIVFIHPSNSPINLYANRSHFRIMMKKKAQEGNRTEMLDNETQINTAGTLSAMNTDQRWMWMWIGGEQEGERGRERK